jgi:hypothetical protein
MKGSAHHPQNGARNLPTVMADHGTHLVLATAQGEYAILLLSAKFSDPQDGTGLLS